MLIQNPDRTANNSTGTSRATCESGNKGQFAPKSVDPKEVVSKSNIPHVDWDKWKPFPPEYAIFSGQLKTIHDWFDNYGTAQEYCDGGKFYDAICNICDKTIEIAELISFLAADDFLSSYYWGNDKTDCIVGFVNLFKTE